MTHHALAVATQCPELAIDEGEAKALTTALERVARHYDMAWLSQRAIDWAGLCNCLAMVYGPRVIAIRMRRVYGMPAADPVANGAASQPGPAFIAPAGNA